MISFDPPEERLVAPIGGTHKSGVLNVDAMELVQPIMENANEIVLRLVNSRLNSVSRRGSVPCENWVWLKVGRATYLADSPVCSGRLVSLSLTEEASKASYLSRSASSWSSATSEIGSMRATVPRGVLVPSPFFSNSETVLPTLTERDRNILRGQVGVEMFSWECQTGENPTRTCPGYEIEIRARLTVRPG